MEARRIGNRVWVSCEGDAALMFEPEDLHPELRAVREDDYVEFDLSLVRVASSSFVAAMIAAAKTAREVRLLGITPWFRTQLSVMRVAMLFRIDDEA